MSNNYGQISSFIWNVCDDVLRGLFKPHEYGDVILPFTVLRRLDCVLEPHKDWWMTVWIYYSASYTLSASSTIVLKSLEFSWEIVDQYETDPLYKLYWEYSNNYGFYISNPITITYGTELNFQLPSSFISRVNVGGHPLADTEPDSLDRIRIHDILDFYSAPTFPFEVRATGYYLLSDSDTSNFNVVHLDTFTVSIDSTDCN